MAKTPKYPNPAFFRTKNNMDWKAQGENLKEVFDIAKDMLLATDWKAFGARQKQGWIDFGKRVAEEAALEDERLCARDLSGGVGLPEGAAGDFGHLDVVGDQPLVANVQLAQGAGVQVHELCHGKFSFSQIFYLHP